MEKGRKKKKGNGKWAFILILTPIIMFAIVVGIVYGVVQNKLGSGENSPKKELVNAVIKDAISNPTEIKEVLDSITITDQVQEANVSNEVVTSPLTTDQNETTSSPDIEQNTDTATDTETDTKSSVEDLKENYNDYDLISSSAEKVEGNTYHLTATIKNKETGEVKNVEVTTALSESTKNMLKNYKNAK